MRGRNGLGGGWGTSLGTPKKGWRLKISRPSIFGSRRRLLAKRFMTTPFLQNTKSSQILKFSNRSQSSGNIRKRLYIQRASTNTIPFSWALGSGPFWPTGTGYGDHSPSSKTRTFALDHLVDTLSKPRPGVLFHSQSWINITVSNEGRFVFLIA